ncbi:hypothetical protein EVAR_63265_1 [Eumeta japonica]|uniref:Uncharacterized protein n=1 Tax=Eumeta variegata TaxID=151549 RepID=A0A4C1YW39_EUMVA|nr:hypothetical protein EVAR_63265_1 [Eumeta japonica]
MVIATHEHLEPQRSQLPDIAALYNFQSACNPQRAHEHNSISLGRAQIKYPSRVHDVGFLNRTAPFESLRREEMSVTLCRGKPSHNLGFTFRCIHSPPARILALVFNKCFDYGMFPDLKKESEVVPIFKGGSKSYPANFRPISVLPTLIQFTRGRSTIDASVELVEKIVEGWEDSRNAIGIFCDLSNAFDCINHETLIRKLHHNGVTGYALDLIASHWTNRIQKDDVNNMRSSGSVFCRGGTTGIDPRKKTKCVKFSLPNVKNGSGSILIGDKELELVDTTVFLGLTSDNKLQWAPPYRAKGGPLHNGLVVSSPSGRGVRAAGGQKRQQKMILFKYYRQTSMQTTKEQVISQSPVDIDNFRVVSIQCVASLLETNGLFSRRSPSGS